jgi:anti-sigma regulatory factor (Ser/Thr protein kinase)
METIVEVREASQVAEVRRLAVEMARAEQMTEDEIGRLSIVASELSTNLVKYGTRGSVVLSRFAEAGVRGVQLVSVDHGPGLPDLAGAMRDGHSTAGSLGIGLGSMKRVSSLFDIYTVPGQGTAVLARVEHAGPRQRKPAPLLALASRGLPKKGQIETGDGWRVRDFGRKQLVCMVDGLGHGPLAALATRRAIAAFEAAGAGDAPADIILSAHSQLKDTRGAVMAVLALDHEAGTGVYCGVGNITAAIVHSGKAHHLLSVEGIVGYNVRKVRTQQATWPSGSVAILNSDGVSARWSLNKYPGLLAKHPAVIASVLFRDHARDTDDATLLVVKGA